MPELREVFEMVTKQTEPDVDAWREQERRHRASGRNRKLATWALVATLGAAAIVTIVVIRAGQHDRGATPAARPTTAPVEIARGFLERYGAFDLQATMASLADDADISGLIPFAENASTARQALRLDLAVLSALRYEQFIGPCEENGTSQAGATVRCAFDFHMFGSDELGLGPYAGNAFDLTIRDGKVERASVTYNTDRFSPQVWEPVAAWIAAAHPNDVDVLYEDGTQSNLVLSPAAVALWKDYLPAYIDDASRGSG
jgi:hypothetical protein